MRLGNFGPNTGGGEYHPPNCTCHACNEGRRQRERRAQEEEGKRLVEEAGRHLAHGGRRSKKPPRPTPSGRTPSSRPRRRNPWAARLLAGIFVAVLVSGGIGLAAWGTGGSPPADTAGPPPPVAEPGAVAYAPTPTQPPRLLPEPITRPVPTFAPTPAGSMPTAGPVLVAPALRHQPEKLYMLELINVAREEAGVSRVALGDNAAAQLHAESMLEHCFSGHWGVDGLKPYMRYSVAGGYQGNGENVSGSDYCIQRSDGYRAFGDIRARIKEIMDGWMGSQGHRRNILDPWHKAVNIGLAWNRYNSMAVQHFEGDYVEYEQLPGFDEHGRLSLAGQTKNGARFGNFGDLGVQVYYDPPPHRLTRGQLSRTYCYDLGLRVAALTEPLEGGWYYDEDSYVTDHEPCADPYDVPASARGPGSAHEATMFWEAAYKATQNRYSERITVPWVTADTWTASGQRFAVKADLSDVLAEHGPGVYTITLWGRIRAEDVIISAYSIFVETDAD